MSTLKGKVKWFNGKKGYGFIEREDKEKDVFVHASAVRDAGLRFLNEGDSLEFSVEDGAGVALAKVAGLKIALLSGRYSSATEIRGKELKIEDIYNGMLNKIPAYEELKQKYNLEDSEIAYIGDGLIDLPVME